MAKKTPNKNGTYCIYVPEQHIDAHKRSNVAKKVSAYTRDPHYLCQITRNGKTYRVENDRCKCSGRGVSKSQKR